MKYVSTRGKAPVLDFEEVLLTGLASDGGLYLPESLPQFSAAQLADWRSLSYPELAIEIIEPFLGGAISRESLGEIVSDSYREFAHPAVAPLIQTGHNEWVLELFQGPTLAFKDFALQLLGRLLDHILKQRDQRVVVLGATSGDTGSAAIAGCRSCDNVDIFILHPHNRVSEVQRRQMTTVLADNVHNIAIEGSFDDCQAIVKQGFRDQSFLPSGRQLVAVNSINWARIMAQIVYYVYAALALGAPSRPVAFSVPTGNFGDIYAGYLASRMGLPVEQLLIATNKNDVMHNVLVKGVYHRQALHHTLSPSMDISVSSNFERLLFDLYDRDGAAIAGLMEKFEADGITLEETAISRMRALFGSGAIDDSQTCETIATVYQESTYLLDPHSATGLATARQAELPADVPVVCLATAHPAKFSEAITRAGIGVSAQLPASMSDLLEREEAYSVLPNKQQAVNEFIAAHLDR